MNRRDLLLASAGAAGVFLPIPGRAAKPCPPPQVSVAGGGSASTTCLVGVGTYTTNFDIAENPLSEGGKWIHLDDTLTRCRSVGGRAFGTQIGGAYDDSNAYLTGFGDNHEVEGTVWLNPGSAGSGNREVEILLHWNDNGPLRATPYGATRAIGYEIMWSHWGAYMILGRFKGAELARASNTPIPRSGDRFRARIEGQRIRAWVNDVIQIDYTDNNTSLNIVTGNPGIGFFVDAGAPNTDFGFDAVTIRAL